MKFDYKKLVEHAVRNAQPVGVGPDMEWKWVAVRDIFAVGKTTAMQLCDEFGIDGWEYQRRLQNGSDEEE